MLELAGDHRLFVGLKMDGTLKRQLRTIEGADRRYVSTDDDTTFLTICKLGDDEFVGKLVTDGLSTDRIDDVRRNVLSILQRLCPDTRLPSVLEVLVCPPEGAEPAPAGEAPPQIDDPPPYRY